MLCTDVHLQLLLDLTAELGVRDHADDRVLDDAVRVLAHLVTERALAQPAGKTRVPVEELLLELVATDGDLFRVDDDDEVTAVDVGRVCRLVLAA